MLRVIAFPRFVGHYVLYLAFFFDRSRGLVRRGVVKRACAFDEAHALVPLLALQHALAPTLGHFGHVQRVAAVRIGIAIVHAPHLHQNVRVGCSAWRATEARLVG